MEGDRLGRCMRTGDSAKSIASQDRDAHLFVNFADERLFQRFSDLNMAAGKAPQARISLSMWTAPGQEDGIVSQQQGVDDVMHSNLRVLIPKDGLGRD
jgi:hypothetical protein